MREGASVSVILVNLACSHWASSLLIFLYAVPESDGVALSGRREEADFFSIKAATGIGSVQFGILCGFAFSGSYLVLGGAASSVVPQRRNLLIVGSLLSCASTVMTGLAGSFWELFSARAVLGLGEWFVNNASHGLLSDNAAKSPGNCTAARGAGSSSSAPRRARRSSGTSTSPAASTTAPSGPLRGARTGSTSSRAGS